MPRGASNAWAYDGLGRLSSETDFAGFNTSYSLDQAGNVWQKLNRLGQATQITYDSLNRPLIHLFADGTIDQFIYDPAGTTQYAANQDGNNITYRYTYDALKRMLTKIDQGRGRSLSFTWDKSSHVLSKTTYQGSTTSYTYDGAGTLVSLSNPDYLSVNYQYDNAGRLLARVMSSGAKSLYTYDTGGWLVSLAHDDATGIAVTGQSYTRDRVGNITAINVTVGPVTGATNYTLDALYRLTVADAPGSANDEAFSYDHLGNILTLTAGGPGIGAAGSTTWYYLYNPATQTGAVSGYTPSYNNRVKELRIGSIAGTLDSSLVFDNEGRLTTQGGIYPRTLGWDAKSRLKTLTQGGRTETYRYDPMDYRIGRSGGALGTLDYFLEGEHLESVEQGGVLTEKYFRGSTIDELVAGYVTQGGKLTPVFFQHDGNLSVVAETKPNGGTQATLSYWSFGLDRTYTGTPLGRQKYTGREDDGTGYYYYRARYYDPYVQAFISEDPLKFRAGGNFYTYVNNNPVNANDPSGLCPSCVGAIYGGISGLVGGVIAAELSPNNNIFGTVKSAVLGAGAGAVTGAVAPSQKKGQV